MTCLVAVAAPIGGGKSALVQGLAAALDGAPTLHFDDYELATRQSPSELERWLATGADFNTLRAPGFTTALQALKRGEAVAAPDGSAVLPGRFAVIEMPLGRAYAASAALIDILIWVETPLDVALARNIRALAAEAAMNPADAQEFLRWLDAYLCSYPQQLRSILQLQKRRVAAAADIVLDGLRAPELLVAEACAAISAIGAK